LGQLQRDQTRPVAAVVIERQTRKKPLVEIALIELESRIAIVDAGFGAAVCRVPRDDVVGARGKISRKDFVFRWLRRALLR